MQITVRLFAVLRDVLNADVVTWHLREPVQLKELYDQISEKHPALSPHRNFVRFALNESWASPDSKVQNGDEVAFLPPISGG